MKIYAILSALIWLAVTLLSHGCFGTKGFFYDLPNGQMPFGIFLILYILSFIFYLIIITKITRLPACRHNIFIVIAGTVVFRLILLPSIPIHENDIYRYIWDGRVFNAGINPYKYAPIQAIVKPASPERQADFEKLRSLRDEDPKTYRRISFKDIPTIYPPLAQAFFALSTLLAPDSVIVMKLLSVLFDLGVVFFLYIILKINKQNPLYIVIYAWNPLVLKEFANSGHCDAIAICCVTAAVYLILKGKYTLSAVSLGLGVLSKIYPLIFIPFLLLKKQYISFLTSLLVIFTGYLPFVIWGHTDHMSVFSGLGTYTREWTNNGFIYSLIHPLVSHFSERPIMISKIICGTMFLLIWISVFINRQDLVKKMFWVVTAIFLLSPSGFPWYFCWVIPFLCIYRSYSLIILSGLLILYYFAFTRDFGTFAAGGYEIDNLLLIQYIPFYLILLFEWYKRHALLHQNYPEVS